MSNEAKIEKNVPVPKTRGSKYPFAQMEVGDSFYEPSRQTTHLVSASYTFRRRHNLLDWKFVARKENYGARIWRVK